MIRSAVLLIISAVAITGCAGSKQLRTTVAREHYFNVALEMLQENGRVVPMGYEHPCKMEISGLKKLMEGLRYTEGGGLLKKTGKPEPVFQRDEIDRLAPVLVDTLAKTDADQRIRFTSFSQGELMVFSQARKTEGVIFVEPGNRLNMAFNSINIKRQSGEARVFDPIYSDADPLKIKDSDTRISAPASYAELHEFENGEQAPMWVVADLEKLENSPNMAKPSPVPTSENILPAVVPESEIPETPAVKKTFDQTQEDPPNEDIRNKLKFLKELLDEGLISVEDYETKKKELLKRID